MNCSIGGSRNFGDQFPMKCWLECCEAQQACKACHSLGAPQKIFENCMRLILVAILQENLIQLTPYYTQLNSVTLQLLQSSSYYVLILMKFNFKCTKLFTIILTLTLTFLPSKFVLPWPQKQYQCLYCLPILNNNVH